MPVYEYKCVGCCEERFEVEQSMSASTLKTIKRGGTTHKVKKVFSAPGIAFKGSGFYKNDSAGSKKKSSSTSKDTSTDSSKSSSSSSETSNKKTSESSSAN